MQLGMGTRAESALYEAMGSKHRVVASVAFSISTTLVLMFMVSRFPGMEIPVPYWIFGTLCPGVISFVVSLQLVRQTQRIRELQRQREDFLELLSHDMRAPQASIIALLDRPGVECEPELAQRIRSYAHRTLKLAEDIVQLSRAQQLEFKPQELNIVDIGQDAVDALAPQALSRRITLEEVINDEEILVRGEPSLLARALINLLDNAVKFSPEASVVRFAIARTMQDKRELVVCSVSDSGSGIPPEEMETLYSRFAKGRGGAGGGAGLGLAFVKTVVTRHDGAIHCDSAEGRGTTFRILLPVLAGSGRVAGLSAGLHPAGG